MWGQNGSKRGAKFGPFLKGPNWPHFIGAVLGSKFRPHFWGQNGPFLFTVFIYRQFFKTTGQNVSFFKHQFSKINKAFNKIMQKQKNWNNILMNNKAKFCIRLLHILPHGCPIIFIDLLYHHEKRLTHKRHISSNIAFTLQNALPSPFNDPTTMVSN